MGKNNFLVFILVIIAVSFGASKLTNEEYQKRLIEAKGKEEITRPQIAKLQTENAALREELESINKQSTRAWKDILDLVESSQGEYDDVVTRIEEVLAKINGLESESGSDFSGWNSALSESRNAMTDLKEHRVSGIPRVANMFPDIEEALSASQNALASARDSHKAEQVAAKERAEQEEQEAATRAAEEKRLAAEQQAAAAAEEAEAAREQARMEREQAEADRLARAEEARMQRESAAAEEEAERQAVQTYASSDATGVTGDQYTVGMGHSLWRIAKQPSVFGNGQRWRELYEANQDKISDPDVIFPGQVLEIPR